VSAGIDAVRGWLQSGPLQLRLAYDLDAEGTVVSLATFVTGDKVSIAALLDDGTVVVWLPETLSKGDNPFASPQCRWKTGEARISSKLKGEVHPTVICWVGHDRLVYIANSRMWIQAEVKSGGVQTSVDIDEPRAVARLGNDIAVGCADGSIWRVDAQNRWQEKIVQEVHPIASLHCDQGDNQLLAILDVYPNEIVVYKQEDSIC